MKVTFTLYARTQGCRSGGIMGLVTRSPCGGRAPNESGIYFSFKF